MYLGGGIGESMSIPFPQELKSRLWLPLTIPFSLSSFPATPDLCWRSRITASELELQRSPGRLLFFKQGDTKLVKAQLLIFLACLTLEFICMLNKYIWTLRKVFKDLKWRISSESTVVTSLFFPFYLPFLSLLSFN